MTDRNAFAYIKWIEYGGVLGYSTERNGEVNIYVMDDGEFEDRYIEYINGKTDIEPVGLNIDEFARVLCKSALINVGIDEKKVEEILNIFEEDLS